MSALASKYGPWLLALLLGVILLSGLRIVAADAVMAGAVADLEALSEARTPANLPALNAIRSRLELGRSLSMGNPETDEQLARWALIAVGQPAFPPDQRSVILEAGLADARLAVQARPVSPYAWSILLGIKRAQGEFDAEFRTALRRAVELGPWEPALLVSLADIGLSAWERMPPEEQSMIQQIFIRGMLREEKRMRQVATVHRSPCAVGEEGCQ